MKFLQENWGTISAMIIMILPVAELIVRLTPTTADDTFVDLVKALFNKVPNRKKGGGTHK